MKQLIIGSNDYNSWDYIKEFKSKFNDDNLIEVDASELSVNEVKELLQSQSLFNPNGERTVIINNVAKNKPVLDFLADEFEAINTDFIIYDKAIDKRSALYKQFKKLNLVKEFAELDDQALLKWLIEEAKRLNSNLDTQTANFLIKRLGKDQWQLANELNKVSLFDKNISKENIIQLTEEAVEETVFHMLDVISTGDKQTALSIAKDLMVQKNDPVYLISMLVWYFHNVAIVKTASSSNDYDIAKMYKVSPFVVGKSRKVANKLSKSELIEIFELLTDADFKQKNVNVDKKQAFCILVIEICGYFKS